MTIDFAGKIAVITGGGTGMGRELARQLVAEGCSVAMCDVSADNMAETRRLCLESAPQGTQVDCYVADVSIEDQMMAWADVVRKTFDTDRIHLLFNNAGVAGGGSFVAGDRASWERTFNICFYGVVHGVRAFLPLLMNAERGHIVNTSSVNGFYASIGPETSHTAYAAAKFAVKGFTESLITDLRLNAPPSARRSSCPAISVLKSPAIRWRSTPARATSERCCRGRGSTPRAWTMRSSRWSSTPVSAIRRRPAPRRLPPSSSMPSRRGNGVSLSAVTRTSSMKWCAPIPKAPIRWRSTNAGSPPVAPDAACGHTRQIPPGVARHAAV